MTTPPARSGFVREFLTGVGILGQGFRVWITAPKLMLLGAIPALIVAAVYLAGIIALALNVEGLAGWLTPFADDWDETARTGVRLIAIFAFLAIAVLIWVYTFTAVTLIVGDPFYERIQRHVEHQLGNAPVAVESGFWSDLGEGLASLFRMLVPTIAFGLMLFALGFIPVVGQLVVPALGALIGGWFLVIEVTTLAFTARGIRLKDRRGMLRSRRPLALGFGVATYLLFLLPFGAVIAMPASVAGATILTRRVLDARAGDAAAVPTPA